MGDRVELPSVPAWLAALPFLFRVRGERNDDLIVNSALASAAAAMAADTDRRDSRSRISFLLAEMATQYGRRTGRHSGWIPVTRTQLARAAQIDLTKVKRILGFLLLSGVIELGDKGVKISDWRRLCKLASYDRNWLSLPLGDEEEERALPAQRDVQTAAALTTSGDPASFV